MFSLLYFDLSDDFNDPKALFNRLGAFFFLAVNLFISYFTNVLITFPAERATFSKEYNSGLYGVTPYFFSKNDG